MGAGQRLDKELVLRGILSGRETAKAQIEAGNIKVNGKVCKKPSTVVTESDEITCDAVIRFVSRGGEKLAAAFEAFALDVKDKVCMDVGASTGGFTDCMLQNGASYVYAIDVGTDQLVDSLRNDPRVCSMEQTNIRYLEEEKLHHGKPTFLASDVSFISLRLVLPQMMQLAEPGGEMVCLIKPQFEAGKKHLNKHGVVTDEKVRAAVCEDIKDFAVSIGLTVLGLIPSPVLGPEGNVEFLIRLKKPEEKSNYRVMLIPNMEKRGVPALLPHLFAELKACGYDLVTESDFSDYTDTKPVQIGPVSELLPECDLLMVVGGDGTIIEYAKQAAAAGKPILGINAGRLGFLSGMEQDGLSLLSKLAAGDYVTEHRKFLEVVHEKADGSAVNYLALNDLVVSHGMLSTIVDIDICCSGEAVNSYRADGVIVSSPTGSTAYALSAGGPIIHPEIACFSVTPICSHSLANRSILFPGNSEVSIRMGASNRGSMFVTCDGNASAPFDRGDTIRVRLSDLSIDLLNLTGTGFYERINEKFR